MLRRVAVTKDSSKASAKGGRQGVAVLLGLCIVVAVLVAARRCADDAGEGETDAAPSGTPAPAQRAEPAPRTPWPALPADASTLDQLIARHTRRPPSLDAATKDVGPEPTADHTLALLRGKFRDGSVVSGWPLIARRLEGRLAAATQADRPAVLLWGVYHDSAAHVAAFRRLTGPMGWSGRLTIATELFDADGRWAAVPAEQQRGDDGALSRYLAEGEAAAFHQLLASQRRGNYTAWKFDYLDEVMDLLVTARATGRPVLGCDMPSALQRQVRPSLGARTEQLRELHCALALRDLMAGDLAQSPIALLWGQAHLGETGFERYLPANAEVLSVRLFGARPSEHDVGQSLSRRLALAAPVLVPTDQLGRRLLLLLPGPSLAARVDRIHDTQQCPLPVEQRHRLRVSSAAPGTFHVRDLEIELDDEARSTALPAGDHSFLFETDQFAFVGALWMPPDGQVELDLEPDQRTVLVSIRSCDAPNGAPTVAAPPAE